MQKALELLKRMPLELAMRKAKLALAMNHRFHCKTSFCDWEEEHKHEFQTT